MARQLLEVVAEVGVFLCDDPVLDVGLDRELDGWQVAGGALWRAGEQPVGGVEDADPLGGIEVPRSSRTGDPLGFSPEGSGIECRGN
jgi:hypothetical protein